MGNSGKIFILILSAMFLGVMLPCHSTANTMNGSMDFDKTVAVVTDTSGDGSTEMIILTREGTSYSLSGTSTWDINELDSPGPHWFRGYVVVTDGNFVMSGIDSSDGPQSGSGTISINGTNGTVSINISPGPPSQPPFQCHLDSGKTVMACTRAQEDNDSMLVMTKRGTSNTLADLAHTWDLNVLSSPGPSWMRGTIIIGSDGNLVMAGTDSDGDSQNATGSTSISGSDGVITFIPDGQTSFPCTLDAGKTVMACTKSSSGPSSDLLIMTRRAPSYSSGDLTGVWHSHSLATGASQWSSSGALTFVAGGFFSGSGTSSNGNPWDTSGKATISASGAMEIQTDDFTATPTSGSVPLIVNFTDATLHNPTSWLWQFGDGSTSTEQNPSHVYTSTGSYEVILTAITAGVPVFVTKTGFINVSTCSALPVNRSGSFYSLIYDGCHNASANGQTVQMQGITFIQTPVLDNNYAIRLSGGYDCIYSSNPGWTTINGKLTIKGKPVTIEKVKIK